MQYVARRRLRLNGRVYEAQQVIPDDQLPSAAKLGSLQRVGYIVQSPEVGEVVGSDSPSAPPPEVPISEGPSDLPNLDDLTVPKLRKLCEQRGLDKDGKRAELVDRLLQSVAT